MKIRRIIENITMFIPYALILGILDYRFHFFYYRWLNFFRPLTGKAFFDFYSVFDLYIDLTAVALLIYLLSHFKETLSTIYKTLQDKLLFWSLSFLALGAVFAAVAYNPTEPIIHSFKSYVNTNYLTPLLTATLLVYSLKTKELLKKFLKHFIFAFSLLGSATLLQYFTGILPGASQDFLNRAVWPYTDPFVVNKPESANWLSYIFAPLFLMSLYLRIEEKNRSWSETLLYTIGIIVGLCVVIASKSYAGLGAMAAVTGLYLFKKVPTIKHKIILVIMGLVMLTGFLYTQKDSQKLQILLGNYKKANSLERRVEIYTVAWEMLSHSPVSGVGPGNFQSQFRQDMTMYLARPIPEDEVPPHAHNIVLHFWTELGLPGALFIVFLYIYAFIVWCKKSLTHLGILTISYVLVHGLADVPFGLQEASTLFFIWCSLVVIMRRQSMEIHIDARD